MKKRRGRRTRDPGMGHWHNNNRLHGYLGGLSPAEYEQAHYPAQQADQPLVGIQ